MASVGEGDDASSTMVVTKLGSRVLSSSEAGPRKVKMDLCEVLLPAYRTIVDTVAQWKQRRSFRTKVRNQLLHKDRDSRRQVLSPHDVQVAKQCVLALKALKQVSERVCSHQQKAGTATEPACLRWSDTGYVLPLAEAQCLLAPLLAACKPSTGVSSSTDTRKVHEDAINKEQSSFASLSLQCFQLLVSHRLLNGTAEKNSLVAEILASVFKCHEQRAILCRLPERQEDLESDILQALVVFCSSPVLEVHGPQLRQAFELLLQVQRLSTSAANRCLAKASAAQLLHLAALKAESSMQVVDPAGASTPLTLLPWSSPRMPLADTLKVVQQCISQLMEEVALPDQVDVGNHFLETSTTAESDDLDQGNALKEEYNSEVDNLKMSTVNGDNLPDIDFLSSTSRGSSCEDIEAAPEESVAIVCLEDQRDDFGSEEFSKQKRPAFLHHRCPDCGSSDGSLPILLPSTNSTSGATCSFVMPALNMAMDVVRSSLKDQVREDVVIEDDVDNLQRSDSKTVESRHSVVQWTRTDSGGSAATTSSNNSNTSTSSTSNRKLRGMSGSGPLRMQALALESPYRRSIQGELLPPDISMGNLESMDKLFSEREFRLSQSGSATCCCSTEGEESASSESEKHEDTVLLVSLLCSTLTSKEPEGPCKNSLGSDVPGRVNIMEQLLWLLDCCGPLVVHCRRIVKLLKEQLCPALLHFWTLADPSTFGLCYSVLLRLVMLFTRPLLPALRLLLPHMLLRPLEEPANVHSRAVWLSLHILSCMAQQPYIVLELYANLDCRLGCGNIVERCVAALVTLSRPDQRTSWELQHAAGEVLLEVLNGLRNWSNVAAHFEAQAHKTEEIASGCSTDSTEEASGDTNFADVSRKLRAKKMFQQGVASFAQQNPVVGLEALREADEMESGASRSDAELLFRYAQSLDEDAVGDLLGKRDSAQLLSDYLSCFNFKDIPIDEALRLLLCTFRIPGEAQKIDRVMEAFAKRFWECNYCTVHWIKEGEDLQMAAMSPGLRPATGSRRTRQGCRCSKVAPFRGGATTAHVLAFSIIMLHTDAHSPAVKTKMSKEDFIRNNRNLDAGHDIPEALLSTLYERILAEEMTSLRGREGVKTGQVVAHKQRGHSLILGSRKLKRRNSLPNRRASTGSFSVSVSPRAGGLQLQKGSAQRPSVTGRIHRRIQFLTAGKSPNSQSLRSSLPAALSALHQQTSRHSSGPISAGAEVRASANSSNGGHWQPALPTVTSGSLPPSSALPRLWGPTSPQPFSMMPKRTAQPELHNTQGLSGRQSSNRHNGFRKSMQRHLAVSGSLVHQEVQRLSLSPRGSPHMDLSELQGVSPTSIEVSWIASESRQWKMSMASGICGDRFWPVQRPSHAQALFSTLAPSVQTLLKAVLSPARDDVSSSTNGSISSQDRRHVAISRSASMTLRSTKDMPRTVSQAGPSLALLHICMECCTLLDLPDLHASFADLLKIVKSQGDGSTSRPKVPRAREPTISPLPRKHLDFEP